MNPLQALARIQLIALGKDVYVKELPVSDLTEAEKAVVKLVQENRRMAREIAELKEKYG